MNTLTEKLEQMRSLNDQLNRSLEIEQLIGPDIWNKGVVGAYWQESRNPDQNRIVNHHS